MYNRYAPRSRYSRPMGRRYYGRPQSRRSVYGARAGYARRPMRRRFTVGGSRW